MSLRDEQSFIALPGDSFCLRSRITAVRLGSPSVLWFDGDEQRVFSEHVDTQLIRDKVLPFFRDGWLALSPELRLRPTAVIAREEGGEGNVLHLRNASDPVTLTDEEYNAWTRTVTESALERFTICGLIVTDVVAVETYVDETTALYLENGPILQLPVEDAAQVAKRWPTSATDPLVRPGALVAYRPPLAIKSASADGATIFYLRNRHLLEGKRPNKPLLGFFAVDANSGVRLDEVQAYIFERPQHPGAPSRLGLYFRGGHEFNVYDEDAKRLRAELDLREGFLRLPGGVSFLPEALMAYSKRSGTLYLTLTHGPGIPLTAAADCNAVKPYLDGLSYC